MSARDILQAAAAGTAAVDTDPNFNRTVLLLKGDGNQGANNLYNPGPTKYLAFSDNSNNNFPITVNGDAYGTTISPYQGNYSGYFAGSQSISAAASSLFQASGDFTIEAWIYRSGAGDQSVFVQGTGPYFALNVSPGTNINVYLNTSAPALTCSDLSVPLNAWSHIALVRSGSTVRIYLNGSASTTTATNSSTVGFNSIAYIGALGTQSTGSHVGYISNFRYVVGRAVYTSNFTPPTGLLGATSGGQNPPQGTETRILACQSNRFIDNSSNNFTITRNGAPIISPFQPFTLAANDNGSGYFDGTGDYLSTPYNSEFNFGTGNLTIECWAYWNSVTTGSLVVTLDSGGNSTNGFLLYLSASGTLRAYGPSVSGTITTSVTTGQWYHIALTRSDNTWTLWKDGTSQGTFTDSGTVNPGSTRPLSIGGTVVSTSTNGYISGLRIVKGTAVYTGNFTPPTLPLSTSGSASAAAYPSTTNVNTTFAASNTSLLALQYSGSVRNVGFIDSSPNYFPITRVSNTTQGTFSPFSVAAGEWSNYFDGTSDFLYSPSNAAFAFGTGDFTVEAWVMRTGGTGNQPICQSDAVGGSTNDKWWFAIAGGGLFFGTHSSGGFSVVTGTNFLANVWYHVAVTRSSGVMRLFVNGENTPFTTSGNPSGYNLSQNGLAIGGMSTPSYFLGYISNLRVIKGSALHTSTFVPSTTPLSNVSGTSILTCQSNRFVDNSSTPKTITRNGDVRVTPFSPFAPTAAYSPSVNGGSMYQAGSGNYLTTTNAVGVGLGTQTWTVSCWIYAATSGHILSISANTSNVSSISFDPTNGGLGLQIYVSGNNRVLYQPTNTGFKPNEWAHIALCHLGGGQYQFYVNGVAITATGATGWYFNNATAGATTGIGVYSYNNTGSMTGYMSDLVVKNGIDGSVPTAPITTPAANTSLLLNFRNAGIFDQTGKNVLETVGNAQVDTNIKKFGTGSMKFDGNDHISMPTSPELIFGTGDFTIEFWVNTNTTSSTGNIIDGRTGASQTTPVIYRNNNAFSYMVNATTVITSGTITTGTWYHLAVVRSGTQTKMFLNGVQTGSTYTDTNNYTMPGPLNIGRYPVQNISFFAGFIDDLRITKGVARYPSQPFPTAPFPNK